MILGVVVISFLASATTFGAALALSYPLWTAAMLYVGTGTLVMVAGAVALALRRSSTGSAEARRSPPALS